MSSMQRQKSPKYIFNPMSHRMIIVGGRVYRRLVKEGYINPFNKTFDNELVANTNNTLIKDSNDSVKIEDPEDSSEDPSDDPSEESSESSESSEFSCVSGLMEKMKNEDIEKSEMSELIARASQAVLDKYREHLKNFDEDNLLKEVERLINEELKLMC